MSYRGLVSAHSRQERRHAGAGGKLSSAKFFICLDAWFAVGQYPGLVMRLYDVRAEVLGGNGDG